MSLELRSSSTKTWWWRLQAGSFGSDSHLREMRKAPQAVCRMKRRQECSFREATEKISPRKGSHGGKREGMVKEGGWEKVKTAVIWSEPQRTPMIIHTKPCWGQAQMNVFFPCSSQKSGHHQNIQGENVTLKLEKFFSR